MLFRVWAGSTYRLAPSSSFPFYPTFRSSHQVTIVFYITTYGNRTNVQLFNDKFSGLILMVGSCSSFSAGSRPRRPCGSERVRLSARKVAELQQMLIPLPNVFDVSAARTAPLSHTASFPPCSPAGAPAGPRRAPATPRPVVE